MGKVAFVFSGQGAQYTGMGKSLCEKSPAARAVFEAADSQRPGTSQQCFTAPVEELSVTKNTQPCVYCVDLAAARALEEAGVKADYVAGFSLGEVAALSFAGVFPGEEGFGFVCKRAEAMQKAAEENPGAMAAVLKLKNEQVEAICQEFEQVWPVNYNCPGQLVVAGEKGQIEAFCKKAGRGRGPGRAPGGERRVPLPLYGERRGGAADRTGGHGAPGAPGAGVRQPERQALHPGGGQGAFGPAGEEPGAVAGDHRGPGRPGGGHLFGVRPRQDLVRAHPQDGEGREGLSGGGRGDPLRRGGGRESGRVRQYRPRGGVILERM